VRSGVAMRPIGLTVVLLLAALCSGCGAAGLEPPPVTANASVVPPSTAAPPSDLLDSPDAYFPLDSPVTVGDFTFTPNDLQGTIEWQRQRSPSGITTRLTYPGTATQVAMQQVLQVEVAAHSTMDELLRTLAPLVLARNVQVTPIEAYEVAAPDGQVFRTPPSSLVGSDDCIAAASYTVGAVVGILTVVVPGCGGSGGVTIDSYTQEQADANDNAFLPQLIVPAVVGR